MNAGFEPIPNFNPYTRRGKVLIARVRTLFPGVTTDEALHCLKTGIWARPRPVREDGVGPGPILAYRVPGIYAEVEFKTTDKTEAERRSRLMDKLMVENSSARNEGMIQALRRLRMDRP